MLSKTSLKFLAEFMNSSSPSGFEEEAAACFRNYLAPCCDEVRTDVLGNTMAVLNPGAPMRVMLAGHYDEIGFQIVYISDEGLLYFRPNGGIDKLNVPSTEVDILTASGRVRGVIAVLGLRRHPIGQTQCVLALPHAVRHRSGCPHRQGKAEQAVGRDPADPCQKQQTEQQFFPHSGPPCGLMYREVPERDGVLRRR